MSSLRRQARWYRTFVHCATSMLLLCYGFCFYEALSGKWQYGKWKDSGRIFWGFQGYTRAERLLHTDHTSYNSSCAFRLGRRLDFLLSDDDDDDDDDDDEEGDARFCA